MDTAAMREALGAVLERIDRELARVDSGGPAAATAYVGGVTKTSAALDHYFNEVWCWLCVRQGLEPSSEYSRAVSAPLRTATAGQLARVVGRSFGSLPVASEGPVRWVCAECREGSATLRFLSVRNDVVHGRAEPSSGDLRLAYQRLRAALGPQLALLS